MKAVVQSAVGEPAEVLKLIDLDVPQPGPGEAVIDVSLAPVHHGDVLQIRAQSSIPTQSANSGAARRRSASFARLAPRSQATAVSRSAIG